MEPPIDTQRTVCACGKSIKSSPAAIKQHLQSQYHIAHAAQGTTAPQREELIQPRWWAAVPLEPLPGHGWVSPPVPPLNPCTDFPPLLAYANFSLVTSLIKEFPDQGVMGFIAFR